MNQLSLHYVTQADREREIAQDLRNRQILDATHAGAVAERSARTIQTQARTTATDLRSNPVRARAAGR
jgi:hypothetical protein